MVVGIGVMARQRQEQGAESKRGIFGAPRGTIECLQFCKNGVLRLSKDAALGSATLETRGGHRRKR